MRKSILSFKQALAVGMMLLLILPFNAFVAFAENDSFSEEIQEQETSDTDPGEETEEVSELDQDAEARAFSSPFSLPADFDPQPTSIEEVQEAIYDFESGGNKPFWKDEVPAEYMPHGYYCALVTQEDDPYDFGADYYTFFMGIQAAVWTGTGTQTDPYVLTTSDDLVELATNVNAGTTYAGAYFELGDNIDISGINWVSIGRYGDGTQRPFAGNFDGNGFAITGLSGTNGNAASYRGYGLFGHVTGEISNLTVELGGTLSSNQYYTGVITGYALGATISICTVIGNGNEVITATEGGGIAGHVESNVTIEGCSVSDISIRGQYEIAGIAGRVSRDDSASLGNNLIRGCSVSDGNFTVINGGYAAGIIGIIAGNNANSYSTAEGCVANNVTTSTSGNYSAGIVGAARFAYVNDCQVFDSNCSAEGYAGGAFGVIYNGTQVDGCAAEDTIVSARVFSGGFIADTYTDAPVFPSSITNSYAAGGRATCGNGQDSGYGAAGFSAVLRSTSSISRCYAQVDVVNNFGTTDIDNFGGHAGFVGAMWGPSSISDCYATGAVNANGRPVSGSFIGRKNEAGTVTNCYGAGTILNSGQYSGGFAGFVNVANVVTNCFYDITTVRTITAIGGPNPTPQGVTGLFTTDMTLLSTFSSWGAQENFLGEAGGSGSDASPWYIDDEITYPYFYYQYDGYSRAQTNYFLGATTYQDGVGLGQKRSDFEIERNSLPLRVISAGAAEAWMPYSGTSLYDISTSSYTDIPGATFEPDLLHSLGGVSQTHIIAFSAAPYAEKTSNRPAWDVDDPDTYTNVGDTITYYITVWNYDSESDFREVAVTDILREGLTLIPGTVTVNSGETYDESAPDFQVIGDDPASGRPYYSFADGARELIVNLEDMPRIDQTTGDISSYTISFQVSVGKEAASEFSDRVTYVGDIENTATLSGELWYTDATVGVDYEYEFSDENLDPVYDAAIFEFSKFAAESDEALEGAEFTIYFWTGSGIPTGLVTSGNTTTDPTVADRWYALGSDTSDADGLVSFVLGVYPTTYPGYFQLVEDSAPVGYETPDGQWLVRVNEIAYVDEITTVQSNDPDAVEAPDFTTTTTDVTTSTGTYTVIDTASLENLSSVGSITVVKFGADDEPLEGATFAIERYDSETDTWSYISYDPVTETWTSTATLEYTQTTVIAGGETDALTVFENLPLGTYRVTEVDVPNGYATLLEPFEGTIPTANEQGVLQYDLTFTVYNDAAFQLPAAGSPISSLLLFFAGLVLVLAAATFLYKRRQKLLEEKALKEQESRLSDSIS